MERGGTCSFGGPTLNVITGDGIIHSLRFENLKRKKWDGGPEITVRIRLRVINCSDTQKKRKKKRSEKTQSVTDTQKLRLRRCLSTRSNRSTLSPAITPCLAWGNRPWARSETPLANPIHLCLLLETAATNVCTFGMIITGQSAM